MGYALARAARNAGAAVTLVSGKTDLPAPYGVHMVPVVSAKDMADAVLSVSDGMDAIIMAAAVADYTPVKTADEKIKKEEGGLQIDLCRTTDILKELGRRKHEDQVLIGFAMETENLYANAQKKLVEKNADFIAANSLRDKGAGFGVDTNKVTILSKDHQEQLGLLSKDDTAEEILKYCLKGERHVTGC